MIQHFIGFPWPYLITYITVSVVISAVAQRQFNQNFLQIEFGYWFIFYETKNDVIKVCVRLTRLCVESAGVEKVSGEVDVHIAEKKQHVASLPGSGPDVKTPSPRKLFVQLQQSVVLKMNFPAETQRGVSIQETRGHLCPVYSKQKACWRVKKRSVNIKIFSGQMIVLVETRAFKPFVHFTFHTAARSTEQMKVDKCSWASESLSGN